MVVTARESDARRVVISFTFDGLIDLFLSRGKVLDRHCITFTQRQRGSDPLEIQTCIPEELDGADYERLFLRERRAHKQNDQ